MLKSLRARPLDIGIIAPLTDQLNLAKTTGFKGVEIVIREVEGLVREKNLDYVKQLFFKAGILPSGWLSSVANMSIDDATYQKDLTELPRFAEIGRLLGCIRVLGVVFPYSDERPFHENFEWHVARLKPVAKILKDHGCRLGLEYIGSKASRSGHRYEFIHNIEGMLDLFDALETNNVGLILDSFHWYTAQETTKDIQRLSNEQVVYVHVADAPKNVPFDQLRQGPRSIPGETGVIDIVNFLKCVKGIGYDGPVVAEPDHRYCDEIKKISPLEIAQVISKALDKLWLEAGLS